MLTEEEKEIINGVGELKQRLEDKKEEAKKSEREGNLARTAEIRYGEIPAIETELAEKSRALEELQREEKMLSEEVDADLIAEIVAKWTGIPVSRMMESESEKLIQMEERTTLWRWSPTPCAGPARACPTRTARPAPLSSSGRPA